MPLMDLLALPETWEAFYEYRTSLVCPKASARELRDFIDRRAYLPVCDSAARGDPFPLPRRTVLSKTGSEKKRVVYTYPEPENTVLKLLTWLLLRRYDGVFADNLWSFRPGRTAKDAVRFFVSRPEIEGLWAYKADVRNYFNSVPVERLLPMLAEVTEGDPALFAFLRRLLAEPLVLREGRPVPEEKGIMAGTPLSAFYANLYLKDLDHRYASAGVLYARYSDDIILFAPTEAAARDLADGLRAELACRGLDRNPEKEALTGPAEGWTFLGFHCRGRTVDVAPATAAKLKAKMRRKARALQRWKQRSGADGERAAAAFIRVFNRKLLESPAGSELSWKHWFFPVINTADTLREIDRHAQDCIRFLVSGKRTKARFGVRYGDLKALGYRSLVHDYYARGDEVREAADPGETAGG